MLQLQSAKRLYDLSAEIDDYDTELVRITIDRERQGVASEAERVAAETSAVVSRLRKYQALANLFAATGRIQATIGVEPEFDSLFNVPLAEFSEQVKEAMGGWYSGLTVEFALPAFTSEPITSSLVELMPIPLSDNPVTPITEAFELSGDIAWVIDAAPDAQEELVELSAVVDGSPAPAE